MSVVVNLLVPRRRCPIPSPYHGPHRTRRLITAQARYARRRRTRCCASCRRDLRDELLLLVTDS